MCKNYSSLMHCKRSWFQLVQRLFFFLNALENKSRRHSSRLSVKPVFQSAHQQWTLTNGVNGSARYAFSASSELSYLRWWDCLKGCSKLKNCSFHTCGFNKWLVETVQYHVTDLRSDSEISQIIFNGPNVCVGSKAACSCRWWFLLRHKKLTTC